MLAVHIIVKQVHQVLGCSLINKNRELGLDHRKTG